MNLTAALQHRSLELVLLRTGDGHYPLHLGHVELDLHDDGELGGALQHRSLELVLLRTGDGHYPRHLGLVELVPGAALQLGQRLNQGF